MAGLKGLGRGWMMTERRCVGEDSSWACVGMSASYNGGSAMTRDWKDVLEDEDTGSLG